MLATRMCRKTRLCNDTELERLGLFCVGNSFSPKRICSKIYEFGYQGNDTGREEQKEQLGGWHSDTERLHASLRRDAVGFLLITWNKIGWDKVSYLTAKKEQSQSILRSVCVHTKFFVDTKKRISWTSGYLSRKHSGGVFYVPVAVEWAEGVAICRDVFITILVSGHAALLADMNKLAPDDRSSAYAVEQVKQIIVFQHYLILKR